MKFIRIVRFGFLFLLVFIFFFQPKIAFSYSDIPKDNLNYPVLIVNEKGGTGSGFFYHKKSMTYLITARHVLFDDTFIIRLPKKFDIPTNIQYKFNGKEAEIRDEKGGIIGKDFIITFRGVLSESERDELINAAPMSEHDAIKQIYTKSQKMELRDSEITLLYYSINSLNNKEEAIIKINLSKCFKNGQVKYHPFQDVALIKISTDIENVAQERVNKVEYLDGITVIKQEGGFVIESDDQSILLNDVIVGNEVFVLGYPTSITGINPLLDIKLPLLRKGIIAGKNEVLKSIILDCPAFYGNSGGLVIEVDHASCCSFKYKAIGLIAQFAPYETGWFQNSGYSIVVPMDFVEDLIATKETK